MANYRAGSCYRTVPNLAVQAAWERRFRADDAFRMQNGYFKGINTNAQLTALIACARRRDTRALDILHCAEIKEYINRLIHPDYWYADVQSGSYVAKERINFGQVKALLSSTATVLGTLIDNPKSGNAEVIEIWEVLEIIELLNKALEADQQSLRVDIVRISDMPFLLDQLKQQGINRVLGNEWVLDDQSGKMQKHLISTACEMQAGDLEPAGIRLRLVSHTAV